ncbi:MAG TPA: hypothetical protein VL383_15580 [Gemmatimonadaceae bacterium]|jgi:uncharacterized protein YbaR (Trm112 family)|nr:hypothetical protein [Gemmatimonadaceae bacterium]
MFIPLVDLLRCPRGHDDTWLVASIDESMDRDIVRGTLGCPICLAEYPIREGVVLFDDAALPDNSIQSAPREEDAVRLAAALDLTDARMTALLHGAWGAYAPILRGLTPAQLLLLNPPPGITSGDGVSIVRSSRAAPVAHNAVAAVALDAGAEPPMVESLVASLKPGARMLGQARTPIPDGLTEMARDEEVWVAQRDTAAAASAPVTLARRSH